MSQLRWQKSSFSEAGSDTCVEVAVDAAGVPYVRDSKRPEMVISTSRAALRAFVQGVKAGEFGRLGDG
ncbi:hypothetical protein SSP35_01_05980 [Streptomyces sp. NBRC 110611]|uniref:DUF397 domain-containing protein n=1 Tax=Streptomyces sp. NBRC 110611 TaxID=1621259 RepID=UPI000831B3D4|nr:DUF397 domain-containing protein [Streptomyces sp. NBRC 110611]GAU65260.1 hypothetical protein SSP35_01_05980 [Streptomyces sp. NBRC 110611]